MALAMQTLSQLQTGARRQAAAGAVLAIACAGVAMASLDLFIVNVALPRIAADLHLRGGGLGQLSWVLNAYAIAYAALLVLFGRIAERHRRDLGFLVGVATFVAASAACGASDSLTMLIACRVIQAAGAALLTPTSLGLVLAATAPARRHGAVRAWTAVGGLAAALGPVIGGLLVASSWRWVFYVNVPVGLIALALGYRLLPQIAGQPLRRPNVSGALFITLGVAALALGLVDGGRWGWGDVKTLAAIGLAAGALALFAAHTAWHANPLIERSLFRIRPFTGASVVAVLFSAAFGAMLLSRVLWAQDVWHFSPLLTGLAIAPGPIMVPMVAWALTGRLVQGFGAGAVIAAGCALFAAGLAWWALAIGLRPDYTGEMLGGMLLTGIGVGLTLPTLMASAAASLPDRAFATGSAVINMLRQIGLAVGVAALVAALGTPASPAATLVAYQRAAWITAGTSLAGALAGLLLLSVRGLRGRRLVADRR
ncbi:MAG TPA: MFS transporter [Solirubrobacteraceae bacterium]|nr:MFS transporter [Solirubrobacteraceae bacterium]